VPSSSRCSAGYRVILSTSRRTAFRSKLTGLPTSPTCSAVAWHHGGVKAVIAHSLGAAAALAHRAACR
jgi:hypothetical protein